MRILNTIHSFQNQIADIYYSANYAFTQWVGKSLRKIYNKLWPEATLRDKARLTEEETAHINSILHKHEPHLHDQLQQLFHDIKEPVLPMISDGHFALATGEITYSPKESDISFTRPGLAITLPHAEALHKMPKGQVKAMVLHEIAHLDSNRHGALISAKSLVVSAALAFATCPFIIYNLSKNQTSLLTSIFGLSFLGGLLATMISSRYLQSEEYRCDEKVAQQGLAGDLIEFLEEAGKSEPLINIVNHLMELLASHPSHTSRIRHLQMLKEQYEAKHEIA